MASPSPSPPPPSTEEFPDYEKQRLANIAERDALLKKLTQQAQQSGLYTKPATKTNKRSATTGPTSSHPATKKKRVANPVKKEEAQTLAPRRTSSRLAGLTADSEVAKRKAQDDYDAVMDAERAKRQRVSGDQDFGDIMIVGGGGPAKSLLLGVDALSGKGIARPYERTFWPDEIGQTTDSKGNKDLKLIRERMGGLALWDAWDPTRIKITPERIYSMGFHPTEAKPLVFAGDKLGHLGIVDASQPGPEVKGEEDDEDDDDDDDRRDPQITVLKPHQRTISAMHTHPSRPQTLFTASYDSSIRGLDLEKSKSSDLHALDDEPVSGIDMAESDPCVLYFTTLHGALGRHDTRVKGGQGTDTYQLSEKKIGGFSLHPQAPHYLATASLDRTMRVWDLRKINKQLPTLVGEHVSRLSVSHAAFNAVGQVATSSYDDQIKIHSFGIDARGKGTKAMSTWTAGCQIDATDMEPEVVVRHNCQTGRWVTILRPQWQRNPQDGLQKFCIGNMNRFVDVYSADGEQLAQLGGDGITAVPAVGVFHPAKTWVAGGTASGKLCLWM